VYVTNDGVHITTAKNAKAKAVFDGDVRRILNQRGAGMAVLIRHGKYFTVYSNLKETSVNPGESIEANEVIGTVQTDQDTGNAELHFQVWHSYDKLDPQQWLAGK